MGQSIALMDCENRNAQLEDSFAKVIFYMLKMRKTDMMQTQQWFLYSWFRAS
jgi:hypothetical protein